MLSHWRSRMPCVSAKAATSSTRVTNRLLPGHLRLDGRVVGDGWSGEGSQPVIFAFAGSFFHVVTWRWPEIPETLTNQLVVVRLDNNAKSPGIVLPKSH